MPDIRVSNLYQWAVLWPTTGGTAESGEPLVGPPVEIRCRWIDRRSESLDPDGQPIALDATVIVDREIPIGSNMWKGKLKDWYGTGSAGSGIGLMAVKTSGTTPDIKNRGIRRRVGLMKFRDSLPETS